MVFGLNSYLKDDLIKFTILYINRKGAIWNRFFATGKANIGYARKDSKEIYWKINVDERPVVCPPQRATEEEDEKRCRWEHELRYLLLDIGILRYITPN